MFYRIRRFQKLINPFLDSALPRKFSSKIKINLDLDYLCDSKNTVEILANISRRKVFANLMKVQQLYADVINSKTLSETDNEKLRGMLLDEALKIPNKTHPGSWSLPGEPQIIETVESKVGIMKSPLTFENICRKLRLLKTEGLTDLTGPRSYFICDQLALIEQALIHYTIDRLLKIGFELISVPDILPRSVVEACGMNTTGERTQVFRLAEEHFGDKCFSGTAEMGFGQMIAGHQFTSNELPKRFVASSRCFRAETSSIAEEKGIYRVHNFTKVEMFGVCLPGQSESQLNEFIKVEKELLIDLGLKFRILEMPPEDFGNQAYRKVDCEVWLPGRKKWAEVSSASDCTDFQSRRLGVTMTDSSDIPHTVNASAAAIPRLLMAIVETHQQPGPCISIPPALQPYIDVYEFSLASNFPVVSPFKAHCFLE